jgi:hypothetical protein
VKDMTPHYLAWAFVAFVLMVATCSDYRRDMQVECKRQCYPYPATGFNSDGCICKLP